jgi:DNA-binding transcriptional LysR family regulator
MWNSRMPEALNSGAIDLAVSLCPEVRGDLHYEPVRSERLAVLVSDDHPLAAESEIPLGALAGQPFVMFPRELAPRLYETLVAVCRRAGFEPVIRSESFHTSWELGVLADVPAVALVPESVTAHAREGLTPLRLSDAEERVETSILWRGDAESAASTAFRDVARSVLFAEPMNG